MRASAISLLTAALLLSACGSGSADTGSSAGAAGSAAGAPPHGAVLTDWPEFGLDPQRSDATGRPTGITAANVGHLRSRRVSLPGTVDSSPIYLHGVRVRGGSHDVLVLTTTYGRTLALDASSGSILWTFTPKSYGRLAGSAQITTASPLADPGRRFVYAASPDGLVHKLSLASGHEAGRGHWPVRITRDPTREKLATALNLDGPDVLAATGGYIGDAPTYQGHLVAISRASGRIDAVFNTLCAGRRTILVPRSCPQSDSAILSRGGAVVEPGGRRVLVSTGNATWDGRRYFGDSVLELRFPGLRLRQAFTPRNQAQLNAGDVDLGSSAPALLGHGRAMVAGKDGLIRVLRLARLNGHRPGSTNRLGGEAQTLPTPGGDMLFTQPAVWHHGRATSVFVADFSATAAYALRNGRLHKRWENETAGTSPIFAGGLLYVYEPEGGGIEVYAPDSPKPIAHLPGAPGHWNSPIVVDGHIAEPEGDGNDHSGSGTLDLFSLR
ncbi:MAG TPA: PQQ-binding-like beta-propeller repeat protein [Solirubrobacterales bacterium]|nr:PQQ-binding-like beta-propeller repeat protein [Solirubrobacterales bacterium]